MIKKLWNLIFPKIYFASYEGRVLRVKWTNGKTSIYHGECTVWFHYPEIKRCGFFLEGQLCDVWSYLKVHGNDYPDAHLKKDDK